MEDLARIAPGAGVVATRAAQGLASVDHDKPPHLAVAKFGIYLDGFVTLPRGKREVSASQELSGRPYCRAPRAHRGRREARGLGSQSLSCLD